MTKRLAIAIVLVLAPAAYAGQFDSFMESGQTSYTTVHPDKKFTPSAEPAASEKATKSAAKPTKVAAKPRAKAKPPVQAKRRR